MGGLINSISVDGVLPTVLDKPGNLAQPWFVSKCRKNYRAIQQTFGAEALLRSYFSPVLQHREIT